MPFSSEGISPARLAKNLAEVRSRIGEAATRRGRPPDAATLVAVTKYADLETIRALVGLGVRHLGESRIQDAEKKIRAMGGAEAGLNWELIGHLQTNKADKAAALFSRVHSVDSLRVAQALNKEVLKAGAGGIQ